MNVTLALEGASENIQCTSEDKDNEMMNKSLLRGNEIPKLLSPCAMVCPPPSWSYPGMRVLLCQPQNYQYINIKISDIFDQTEDFICPCFELKSQCGE